jgi:hypothetical protein
LTTRADAEAGSRLRDLGSDIHRDGLSQHPSAWCRADDRRAARDLGDLAATPTPPTT